MVQVIPQTPSLGELLGGGITKGIEADMKGKLAERLQQQKGITQFQALSTQLREKDQSRKIESAVSGELLKLADPFFSGQENKLDARDVPNLSSETTKLINKGANPQQALAETVGNYNTQKEMLAEMEFPRFKAKKLKQNQESILGTLRENNVNNPNLVNRKLQELKYPYKARQDILKGMKGGQEAAAPVAEEKPMAKASSQGKKLSFEKAQVYKKKAKGDKEKARELARKDGYSF